MSEIGVRYVTIMPRVAAGAATQINATIGKGAAQAGKAAGKQVGDELGKGVEQSASRVGTAFKSVVTGALVLGGVRAISGFVRSSVDAFAELEDATGAAEVVFGDSMDKIIKQSETAAKTMYMSKAQVIDAANTYGTLGKSAGLAGDDLAKFSTDMTQLAADLSSFKGGRPEDAVLAIGAALRGESEPIRRYGVQLNDAMLKARALKMGLIETEREALTPANRTLAAQAEILAQTTDAQGDAIRTAGTASNTQKELAATSADLSAEIGEKLAPAIVSAQRAGIGLIEWTTQNQELLIPLAKAFGIAAAAIGGFVAVSKGIEALKSARETIKGIGDAFQAMGTKAKIATASAGAVGLALTAAAVVYGVFAQRNAEAEARVEDFTAALEADTGALGQNTRAAVVNALEKQGLLEQGRAMGIAEKDLTDAVMGSADAMERVSAAARAAEKDLGGNIQGQALARGETVRFIGAIQGQNSELNAAIEVNKRVTAAMGDTDAETKAVTTSVTDGKLAYEDYTKAIEGAYTAQLKFRGDERAVEAAIDDAADAIDEYREALEEKYKKQGKSEAQAKKLAEADIKAGKALDVNTEAGRRNQDALDGIAAAALQQAAGMSEADVASGRAAEEMDRARKKFVSTAKEMGLSSDEAEELAEKLGLLKSKTVKVNVQVTKTGISTIEAIPGKGHKLFTMKALARGGGVFGGIPGKDSVPALLMPDEHVLTTEDVKNLGGHQGVLRMRSLAGKGMLRFASGGPVMPTYQGHSLDYWEDYLLTDLEETRLQIRIKDLKASLAEKETYYTGKGKKRKKKKRDKLRDLERTEATLELQEAEEKLQLAKDAAKANAGAAGTIADQITRYETALKISEDAASSWQSAAASLGKGSGISLTGSYKSSRDAAGNLVYTGTGGFDAASFLAQKSAEGDKVLAFVGKLDRLRDLGAPKRLVDDIMALGAIEGSRVADAFLADPTTLAGAQSAYGKLATAEEQMQAIGVKAASAAISITTVNPVAEPTSVTIAKALQYAAAAGVI